MDRLDEGLGRVDERVVTTRPNERVAAARDPANGQIYVVEHGEAGEKRGDLVGPTQSAADSLIGREEGDVFAEKADCSRGRRKVAGDAVEQRRLAGAVRTEDSAPLARPDRERDVS